MITEQLTVFGRKLFSKKTNIYNPKTMVYVLGFLYALHITPSVYIDSLFLTQFVGSKNVGLVFSVASFFAIIGIVITRRFLQIFGNYITFKSVMYCNLFCFAILSTHLFLNPNIFLSSLYVLIFIIGFISRTLGFLSIDIFLEHYSHDSETGGIRGIFLTCINFAFISGPLLAAFLVRNNASVANTYVWGALFAFVILIITKKYFKSFDDRKYDKSRIFQTFRFVKKDSDLKNIFLCNFLLNLFYAIAIIYIPIYLKSVIGFSISKVALIIAISQIPFILLQIPMGRIADKILGEKEMLTGGLIIAALGMFLITQFSVQNFWLWTGLLLLTRTGASAIELMTESYLFKKINSGSINILGLFRVILPSACIVAPVVGSLLLVWFDLRFLFLLLSFVLIHGIKYSLRIVDTR